MTLDETIRELDKMLKKLEEVRNERGEPIKTDISRAMSRIKEAKSHLDSMAQCFSRQKHYTQPIERQSRKKTNF